MTGELTAVSLFDGIAGFPLALSRAGIRTTATVEIDKAAAGVAADHFPGAAHFDDVTEVTADDLIRTGFVPDRGIVTAGWPCTDISLAGLRLGLGGARSGLIGPTLQLIGSLRPRWVLLENVPGLLSSVCPCPGAGACDDPQCGPAHTVRGGACGRRVRRGRATGTGRCMALHGGGMGTVLGELGQRGYGIAYRVLDAQYFGVPQRRRRVVIVGCLGDWAAPAQVLLEPEGGGGGPAQSRAARASAAGVAAVSTRVGGTDEDGRTVGTLGTVGPGGGWRLGADEAAAGQLVPVTAVSTLQGGGRRGHRVAAEPAAGGHLITVNAIMSHHGRNDPNEGGPIGFDAAQITSGANRSNPQPGDPQPTLAAGGAPHVAYALRRDPGGTGQGHNTNYVPMTITGDQTHALTSEGADASEDGTWRRTPLVSVASAGAAVRRLTPVECERLQGFPDNWTATSDGKPQSDSARYRQLGNSIAVPVFAWVAQRITTYEQETAR